MNEWALVGLLLVAAIALHFVLVALGLYVFGPEGSRLPGFELPAGLLAGLPVAPQTLAVVAASAVPEDTVDGAT